MDANGNVAWAHTNVWADGELNATYDPNGLHFYLSDWNGTRRVQTDYEGVVERTCTTLPYSNGESCGPSPTEDLYASLQRDSESGLDHDADSNTEHAEFRQYNSAQGRWLSPDPASKSYDYGNPQSLNRYAYVLNNPLSMTDPRPGLMRVGAHKQRPWAPGLPVTMRGAFRLEPVPQIRTGV